MVPPGDQGAGLRPRHAWPCGTPTIRSGRVALLAFSVARQRPRPGATGPRAGRGAHWGRGQPAPLAEPVPADLALPALVVADVRRGRWHRFVGGLEEVAGRPGRARCRCARPARRRSVGAPRAPPRRRGRRPAGRSSGTASPARRAPTHRPVPVTEQHPAVACRAAGCRRGCRCAPGCRRPSTSANRAASAAASSACGRSGLGAARWSQYAGHSAELGRRCRRARGLGRRGEDGRRRRPSMRQHGGQVGVAPRPLRGPRRRRTRCRGPPSRRRRAPTAAAGPAPPGERGQLARLLAVGLGEHPLRLQRGRLHEVPRCRPRRSAPRRTPG